MVKRLFFVFAMLLVFTTTAAAQNSNSSSTNTAKSTKNTNASKKRGPVFRATKDQIMQAQAILKERSLYSGEQTGKLDDPTRAALKAYQKAEGLKVTGTLNKVTLEKMNIALTDKQKTM
jgi:peptidoglycan hydrolase-like protein with peptidoglycan-binding domain